MHDAETPLFISDSQSLGLRNLSEAALWGFTVAFTHLGVGKEPLPHQGLVTQGNMGTGGTLGEAVYFGGRRGAGPGRPIAEVGPILPE